MNFNREKTYEWITTPKTLAREVYTVAEEDCKLVDDFRRGPLLAEVDDVQLP